VQDGHPLMDEGSVPAADAAPATMDAMRATRPDASPEGTECTDTPDRSGNLTASRAPVLFVADGDVQARDVVESALVRRFGADYRVVTAATAVDGLEALQRLAQDGADVAIVAADAHLPDMDAVEFLQRAHALHPRSNRVLLVPMDRYRTRVPFTELPTIQRATALGRIDLFIVKGWVTPEEWLYPQVQQALTAWTIAHRSRHLVYRIVGEQWALRSHQLRDMLGATASRSSSARRTRHPDDGSFATTALTNRDCPP